MSNEEAAVPTGQICPECGQAFDGDRCWVCVARGEDIYETLSFSVAVAGAGFIGTIFAAALYPPLQPDSVVLYWSLGLFFPGAIVFALLLRDRLMRYAALVRLIFALGAATFLIPAAYYFLNGALDGNPPVEVQALVSSKSVGDTGHGDFYVLELSLSWQQQKIEKGVQVSPKTFSAAKPGDSVRVTLHPGAFSRPWYSDVLLSDDHDHNPKKEQAL